MTQAVTKLLNFQEFLDNYPENQGKYELIKGEIVEMRATRGHDNVARFLWKTFDQEIEKLGLNYVVDRNILIKTITSEGKEQGRIPDVSIVNKTIWNKNISDYNALTEPLQLAVEVTSTNWEDDYVDKLDEYQRLGITEYWIVDYKAIAPFKYLGNSKIPTLFVYYLVNNKYELKKFIKDEYIVSPTFPKLQLTINQVIASQIA
jgi:Uma2 family endonuclease